MAEGLCFTCGKCGMAVSSLSYRCDRSGYNVGLCSHCAGLTTLPQTIEARVAALEYQVAILQGKLDKR